MSTFTTGIKQCSGSKGSMPKSVFGRHLAIFIAVMISILTAAGCGNKDEMRQQSSAKVIFGENDSKKVLMSESDIAGAIGLMTKGCTVTHIGNGLAITAGHCIAMGNSTISEDTPCGNNTDVVWGYTEDNKHGSLKSTCVGMDKYYYKLLPDRIDFAVLRYDPFPAETLSISKKAPGLQEKITIYSHPDKRTLETSGWCEVKFNGIGSDSKFGYFCDTERGSSGAPVMDERMQVIGIHNGGKLSTYNHATPLSALGNLL